MGLLGAGGDKQEGEWGGKEKKVDDKRRNEE